MTVEDTIIETFELDPQRLVAKEDTNQMAKVREVLIQRIDELIRHDFEKLKWILYRIDISEQKLTQTLKTSDLDAATVMADMIIARQLEKAESRKKFGAADSDWSFDV
jgi:hypothetical protein